MADYRNMYTTLFNKITDAVKLLQTAQADTEEMYISQANPDITVLDQPDGEE